MATISQLQKEARKAPKFILAAFNSETEGYVFVADRNKTGDNQLTENVSKAELFSYGFDNEEMKEKAWSIATGFEFIAIPA